MFRFKSIYFVIFVLNLYKTKAEISDKRLCVDVDCKEPVSLAKTLIRYSSPDSRILSFAPNQQITIFSKEAGSETGLWGAELNGKRGYVPKHLVQEFKMLNKPKLFVDTELKQKPQVPVDGEKGSIDPNKAQRSFDVVDGTTIYLGPQDGIKPTSTESPILATAVPAGNNEVEKAKADSIMESEEPVTVKDHKEDSVVDNVLSKLSSWMASEDISSEEYGDAEDEEEEDDDDDDNEVDEDEEILEESDDASLQENLQNVVGIKDPNSLHNLPPGMVISPYGLELDQPTKQKNELNKDIPLKHDLRDEGAKNTLSLEKENDVIKETVAKETTVFSSSETNAKDITVTDKNAESNFEAEESPPLQEATKKDLSVPDSKTGSVTESDDSSSTSSDLAGSQEAKPDVSFTLEAVTNNSVAPENESHTNTPVVGQEGQSLSVSFPGNPEIKEEVKIGTDKEGNSSTDEIVTEAVTEPSFIEEDPMPFLDEVTPNPMENILKTEEITKQTVISEPIPPHQTETSNLLPPIVISNKDKVSVVPQEILTEKSQMQAAPGASQQSLLETVEINTSQNVNTDQNPKQNQIIEEKQSTESFPTPSSMESNFNQDGNENVEKNNDLKKETNVLDQFPSEEYISEGLKEKIENITPTEAPQEAVTNNNLEGITSDDEEGNVACPEDGSVDDISKVEDEKTSEVAATDDISVADQLEAQKTDTHSTNEEASSENNGDVKDYQVVSDSTEESGGVFSGLLSEFGDNNIDDPKPDLSASSLTDVSDNVNTIEDHVWSSQENQETVINYCDATQEMCNTSEQEEFIKQKGLYEEVILNLNSDIFLYLITTSVSVIVFLFGYMALDRNRREAPLVARINKLEKELLITLKENEILQEKGSTIVVQEIDAVPNVTEDLMQKLAEMQMANQVLEMRIAELGKELEVKEALEEQIESLEKELETSTEVGMELNRIISEMLDPTNGSEMLKKNFEQLQRQLLEQKDTINTINMSLNEKESENQILHAELEKNKKKVVELQDRLDEVVDKILKIEKEKNEQQSTLQNEITIYRQKINEAASKEEFLNNDIQILRMQLAEAQRQTELKGQEYHMLQESLKKIKSIKSDSASLKSILDATSAKAELQQLKIESQKYAEQLQQEQSLKVAYEKKYQAVLEEINLLQQKYEQADKAKVEASSKLEVLNNYFKKRETELQEELIKYKSIWEAKEGEATSTTERIKHMQEEIENYKAQNETLKQEIISQEIDLKSQISVLEKKVHENWVTARQTERKLDDARQEAAQLRNRLTLRERVINEERSQNRLQSPIEQNGELPLSPHPIESPASPPLLYGGRDHITKSPPLPGLPPFLPPPPGAPFMPPPIHGMPPFMPPPPSMFPGDHRPPPLGRMSSPPLNSRYSPETTGFSPYDRRSPSPPYDSEYGTSPPPIRGYSPYNNRDDRRDYKRPPHVRSNGRNLKGSVMSSGSDHSNDSLDKINRKQSKMV